MEVALWLTLVVFTGEQARGRGWRTPACALSEPVARCRAGPVRPSLFLSTAAQLRRHSLGVISPPHPTPQTLYLPHPTSAYGTYILASPKVPTSCWDNNPCAYSTEIPAACTGALNAEGVATLSNACQLVVSNMNDFQ